MTRFNTFCLLAALSLNLSCDAQEPSQVAKPLDQAKPQRKKPALDPVATAAAAGHQWGAWVEPDFPFFSTVLDARVPETAWPQNNLIPRGLVFNLGEDLWACFDTDLLRIACVWKGERGQPPVTEVALATGSYHVAGQKTKDGQDDLPKPVGQIWQANGIYPGWSELIGGPDQEGTKLDAQSLLKDPRTPTRTPEEVGRGPLDESQGRFLGLEVTPDVVLINYVAAGVAVQEVLSAGKAADGSTGVIRRIKVAPSERALVLTLGQTIDPALQWSVQPVHEKDAALLEGPLAVEQERSVVVKPRTAPVEFTVALGVKAKELTVLKPKVATLRWPQTLVTKGALSTEKAAYVMDDVPLPLDNPWKRNVRLADVAFIDDKGTAVGVTFDGDVWWVTGLADDLTAVKWKRFASGLHEPMSIVSRAGDIFVYDRNGVWRLRDTDGDLEADHYEMFCNRFGQTAETREFPNSMKLGPDGSLYISKGGQEGATYGKDNGTVLRIYPDGKKVERIAYGLRQPFIGVHPKTGLVTASDQQGNYVPATPLHILKNRQFYGHLPTIAPKEKYPAPIAEALTWIPHPVNPSGVTQTWLVGAKMGPLNDELIHLGYNRPELFRVLINDATATPQAAVLSFTRKLDIPPLNATVNPADGQLYVSGFQVWGTTAKKISGLERVRYTGEERILLKACTPTDKGLLLQFNEKLDPTMATTASSYSVERWNYRRTPEYGSPHLKLDGAPGQEWIVPSSAYLSQDGRSVFVGIPGMKAKVMQMRIGYGLKGLDGTKAENTAYFTPHDLVTFDPVKEGFGELEVDLTPREADAVAVALPTEEEGGRLALMMGCLACHSVDGSVVGKVGPSWKGLFSSERLLKDGKTKVKANEEYLKESILDPSAKVVKGFDKFDAGMPIYAGILSESQIQSLILYIKSVK